MNITCFRNADIFINGQFEKGNLYTKDGLIVDKYTVSKENIREIDCTNLAILPGIIDLNILPLNRILSAKNINGMVKKALSGGVSTIFINPYTNPSIDNEAMNALINSINDANIINLYPLIPSVKDTNDTQLNNINTLHSLNKFAKGIFADSNIRSNILFQSMKYAKMLGITMCVNANDGFMERGIAYESSFARSLGLPMKSQIGQIKEVAKIKEMAKMLDINLIFTSLNIPYCIDLISNSNNLYSQVPLIHLIFDELNIGEYDTRYKISPPLLTTLEKEKLQNLLINQKISFLTSLHNRVSNHLKMQDFESASSGLDGLGNYFSLCYTLLVKSGKIDLNYLVRLTSSNLAHLFNLNKGSLAVGYDADFMIVDLNEEKIIQDSFSPFNGIKISPSIKHLVVNGEVNLIEDKTI